MKIPRHWGQLTGWEGAKNAKNSPVQSGGNEYKRKYLV